MSFDPRRQLDGRQPITVLEQWVDAQIRHQIGLLRVAGRIRNESLRILDASETEMKAEIRRRLSGLRGVSPAADERRIQRLVRRLKAIRDEAWDQVLQLMAAELSDVAIAEPETQRDLMVALWPLAIPPRAFSMPFRSARASAALSTRFEGRTFAEWGRSMRATDARRIEDAIRIGVDRDTRPNDVVRRVVGSTSARGADGATAATRRNIDAVTRTAVNHAATRARQLFTEANPDVFEREVFVAVLDGSTTPICRAFGSGPIRDRLFPVGEGPIPPLHIGCRSERFPWPSAEAFADRPMKNFTQRSLLREFSASIGLPRAPLSRKRLPEGLRGEFDAFAKKRIPQLVGRADFSVGYDSFLKRQTLRVQDDILGPTRAKLFRSGDLKLTNFVDNTGRTLTLKQLAAKHRSAFESAGLDASAFN